MAWTTNLLVIANRTVDSDELLRVLRDRALSGSIHVTLVAPADAGRVPATRRLEHAVERLKAQGISVQGSVGAPDPLVAVEEVWDPRRFDEIIVATLPTDVSRWMALDLPRRIARLTDAKVTHVVASRRANTRMPRAHA
ncbi:MAG: hypothetical protein AVDCRST_MAG67-4473 [uncultured Solirubrobacteraceae bacterium]|uniref:UspA domain-containing protein n=1 Tax=uncultured Solirubrobacteraceae bacterium TaxID=1162706 RepID=A0A6J4TVP6_9ACTN|nr:MAG: hypothetical protein AVDCRST_MAG67-4473 [uncultured Solirubrobacteraceae bacterium]